MLALLTTQVAEQTQTVGDFLESGGMMMIPLCICSVVVLAYSLERFLSLRKGRICPADTDDVLGSIQGGDYETAEAKLVTMSHPAARILKAGMRRRGFALRDIEGAMEDQGHKEVEKMRRNIRPLSLIAGVAPMMGLLGTVLGISTSFGRVVDAGMGKPEVLAGGIEEALTTTIAGLFVAIPALMIASYLKARVRRQVLSMDEKLGPVVELLAGESGTGGGTTGGRATGDSHAA